MRIPGFDLGNSPREYLEPTGTDAHPLDDERDARGRRGRARAASACSSRRSSTSAPWSRPRARTATTRSSSAPASRGRSRSTTPTSPAASSSFSDWERTDASEAAARLAATWSGAEEAFRASKSGRNLLENAPELEDDIPFCARESVLDVVPRFAGMRNGAAEILP